MINSYFTSGFCLAVKLRKMSVVSWRLSIPDWAGLSANSCSAMQGNLIHCIASPRMVLRILRAHEKNIIIRANHSM